MTSATGHDTDEEVDCTAGPWVRDELRNFYLHPRSLLIHHRDPASRDRSRTLEPEEPLMLASQTGHMSRKWIAYGVTGALGVAVLGGGAVAAANALDLRTASGDVIADGAITGADGAAPAGTSRSGAIALRPLRRQANRPHRRRRTRRAGRAHIRRRHQAEQVSAVSSPEATQTQTTTTQPPAGSAPSPVSPASPATPDSPDSVQSADSD